MEPTFGIVEAGPVLEALWPKCEPLVCEAMRYSASRDWTGGEVRARLQSGEWKLVTVDLAGELIGVQIFGWGTDPLGRRYVGVVCCAGQDMQSWIGGMVKLGRDLAVMAGADRVVIQGRPGWARVLRGWGLKVQSISAVAAVADINVG